MNKSLENSDVRKNSSAIFDGESEQTLTTSEFVREFFQSLGAYKHAKVINKINTALSIAYLSKMKQLYKNKDEHALAFAPSFQLACQNIGLNYKTVNEHIQSLIAFGDDAFEAMEKMGLPIRDQRMFRKLEAEERQSIIDLINDDRHPEDVKAAIRNLYQENIDLRDTVKSAQLKEKAGLVEDAKKLTIIVDVIESKMTDLAAKNKKLQERIRSLLLSNSPGKQVEAFLEVSTGLETLLLVLKDGDLDSDDAAYTAAKSRLQILINEASTLFN